MDDGKLILLLIGTITSLVGGIIFMYFDSKKIHKKYADISNENLLKMTTAMLTNSDAIKSNTAINKEVKDLMHTVNHNILEIKFKNGKK